MEIDAAVSVLIDTFNRWDMESFIAICTPDVELRPLRGMLEEIEYQGHAGLREFQADAEATWKELEFQPAGVEAREDGAVLGGFMRLRGRASGALTERSVAIAVHMRDGLVSRVAIHPDGDSARRELGWQG
jgi:ketosteroid isomerase-like protein